jgi:hypothetical protein
MITEIESDLSKLVIYLLIRCNFYTIPSQSLEKR